MHLFLVVLSYQGLFQVIDNKEYNDYELVSLAQDGNEDAINIIYQKYKPIIIKKSKYAIINATHHGVEINDIMQEGYIGLDEAIRGFSQDSDASFYTFALLCIERKIVNYLRNVNSARDKILNDAINIDDNLERVVSDNTDIELSFFSQDNKNHIIEDIRNKLTDFELEVFNMKLDGYTFEEIANTLNKDIKAIYNTFHRIKTKIKKYIKIDG